MREILFKARRVDNTMSGYKLAEEVMALANKIQVELWKLEDE